MIDSRLLSQLVKLALDEDLAYGDVTSRPLTQLLANRCYKAQIIAREDLVVCGVQLISLVFAELGSAVGVETKVLDGTAVVDKTPLAFLTGPATAILMAERTILNFLQRLSGIATHVREIIEARPEVVLLDTRKTTPGWRVAEKYAVQVGGAGNHRFGLGDMVMVKNNHLDLAGDQVDRYLAEVKNQKPYYAPMQIEVRSLEELRRISKFEPDAVLLDNMSHIQIKECVDYLAQLQWRPVIEVSGRMTPEQCAGLKSLGVDTVSTSYLMHGARPVDLSLRILES